MARPRKYNPIELAKDLDKYTEENDNPTIEGFCIQRGIHRDSVYRLEKECEELNDSIKRCHQKQEERIVRLTEEGKLNTVFSIFRLKQKRFGWKDKQEIDIDAKVQMPPINLGK